MSMTKFQGGVIAAVTLALSIPLAVQYRANHQLKEENQALRAEAAQVTSLQSENRRLSNLLSTASQRAPAPENEEEFLELMRLRGEVGTLRRTATQAETVVSAGKQSPLSSVTANPEMSEAIRNQQKMGLSMIYGSFAARANVTPEQVEALTDLLADEVMINIQHVETALRESRTPEELDRDFSLLEAQTDEKVRQLLGDEGFDKFKRFNRNLVSSITAEQFQSMVLKGDTETKEAQGRQLFELLQQETERALASAGLPPDFQVVPSLNFRNFASEEVAEKNLTLLSSIYGQVYNQAGCFLSPEELEKFAEFSKMAINNNRVALAVNRKLMAPAVQAE